MEVISKSLCQTTPLPNVSSLQKKWILLTNYTSAICGHLKLIYFSISIGRVFNRYGGEIDDLNYLLPGEILLITTDESKNWIRPKISTHYQAGVHERKIKKGNLDYIITGNVRVHCGMVVGKEAIEIMKA